MCSKRSSRIRKRAFQLLVRPRKISPQTPIRGTNYEVYLDTEREKRGMKLKDKIEERAASGYILLWLLGVPIPVLLLFFLLRGCN